MDLYRAIGLEDVVEKFPADILKTGTIFMDLYRPYVKKDDKSKCCKGERDE